jgi:DNA-binding NtrC family response regulator
MTANRSTRLLILDDDRIIVDTFCIIVNQYGYQCRGSRTHSSAVAIAREFQPDVFITGFNNLCDKNGCETAIEILEFLPGCVVFISSGAGSAADALNHYRQRGYEFKVLPKPVQPQVLLETLRSLEGGK